MFNSKNTDKRILSLDLFILLGLENLSVSEKEEYTNEFTQLVNNYFLAQKVSEFLDEDQLNEVTQKFNNGEEITKILQYLAKLIPDLDELYIEALTETKARVVKDQYLGMKQELEEKMKDATEEESTQIKKKLQKCENNINYVISGEFEKINYQIEE